MVSKERMTLARDWAIGAERRGFDRSLAAILDKGLVGLGDRLSEVKFWFLSIPRDRGLDKRWGLGF